MDGRHKDRRDFGGGRYTVLRALGRGGFGTVYEAVDRNFDLHVAVKVIETAELSAEERASFQRLFDVEAKIARRLEHQGIVRVQDYDPSADPPFIVMSLVEGGTLQERLSSGKQMTWEQAVEMAIQVSEALHYAHSHGVKAHRDIKPANVFCIGEGSYQLGDFGIARVNTQPTATRTRSTFFNAGTPRYMAPEQISAPRSVDARSDLFALAVVLYEAISGRAPYRTVTLDFDPEEDPDSAGRIVASAFTPPARLGEVASVPPAVEKVVHRALESDPAKRYPDCAAFAQALRDAREGKVKSAGPWRLIAAAAAAVLLLASIGAAYAVYRWRGRTEKDPIAAGARGTSSGPVVAPERTATLTREQHYEQWRNAIERKAPGAVEAPGMPDEAAPAAGERSAVLPGAAAPEALGTPDAPAAGPSPTPSRAAAAAGTPAQELSVDKPR